MISRATPRSFPRLPALAAGLAAIALAACSNDAGLPGPAGDAIPATGPWNAGVHLPAEPQEAGDPENGRRLLLNGDFMTCGIPWSLYSNPVWGPVVSGGFGATTVDRIPGREGKNADMPYSLNVFTAPDGAEVVNANCLMCHGGKFDGQVVVGLGNATADFTGRLGGNSTGPLDPGILDLLGLTPAEEANLNKMLGRAATLAPATVMRSVGNNPAELYAVILMVHHDRDTLAWSDEPVTQIHPVDVDGSPITDYTLTSDPPPWWRAHKKNALFYNGMARGDHRGTMALATSVCVDDVDRAREVDAMFRDIQAYVSSLRAPTWSRPVDRDLAATGKGLFTKNCAGCHGTYADDPQDDEHDTYPNLLLPLDVIGTDPVVANLGVIHSPELVDWYNASFYGGITRMVPNDPFPGYMPPPLDGIWATAPYLHNGSVPTIELVLNSRARPAAWRRVDLDSTHYDAEALGWPWIEVPGGQASVPEAERKFVYDTSFWSQSNAGHPFGDHLTDAERRALLEYLKTL